MDQTAGGLSKDQVKRRDWIKTAVLAGAALTLPRLGVADAAFSELQTSITRLKLRHTWTTTMSSSEFRDTLCVHLASPPFSAGGLC